MSGRPDIAWSKHMGRASISRLLLWSGAAIVALGAHAGAAWWIMRVPPPPPLEAGEPIAIMIDLAPMPVAPAAEEEMVADTVDSAASEAVDEAEELEPVEPVETAQEAEPDPVETVSEQEPVEPESEVAEVEEPAEPEPVEPEEVAEIEPEVPLPQVAPLPTPKPDPRPAPKVAEKPKPKQEQPQKQAKQQKPAPSREARPTKLATQQAAAQPAAPQSNRGAASNISPARWQSKLMAHLERRKRYPAEAKRARQEGTAQVRFTIDENGNVQSVSLAGSSGFPALDEEVIAMVRRASPVPPPPPGVSRTIVVPVRFNLR